MLTEISSCRASNHWLSPGVDSVICWGLRSVYTYCLCVRVRHCQIYIVCIVTVRMGSVPILPVKRTITIGTMLKFNGDGHGHGDGDGMCKQTFTALPSTYFFLTACCRCCIFSRPEGEVKYCKNTAACVVGKAILNFRWKYRVWISGYGGCSDLWVAGCTHLWVAGCTHLWVAGCTRSGSPRVSVSHARWYGTFRFGRTPSSHHPRTVTVPCPWSTDAAPDARGQGRGERRPVPPQGWDQTSLQGWSPVCILEMKLQSDRL